MKPIIGVYAGSFDPPTVGHEYAIRYCAQIATKLYVAVGVNPDKKCLFSLQERINMLRDITQDLPNVEVTQFSGEYLVDYADSVGANCLFRGIRHTGDWLYEIGMCRFNAKQAPHIQTWFLPAPSEMVYVSSSFVKGLVGAHGWEEAVREYLPRPVYPRFVAKSTELLAHKMIEHSKDIPEIIAEALPEIVDRALPRVIKHLLPRLPGILIKARRKKNN